ncbi:alpha/beta hydrolase [Levilactobacillus spicheri]|uniref:Lipase/esterase n=2 Tax=Levilactobacillus spicheri TaxID=216463 RepID=A0ABQ0WXM5_9LACO|nr:alpha/beta hydrolase [Levilactobacillus spicheri]KRL46711.1 esterase lipase [Levilactobacillus spicheri DSM 15429]GEO67716.1 lipase/esterase [Levilactobacillus spicheri]
MQIITESLGPQTHATLHGYLRRDAPAATYPAIIIVPGGSYTHIPEQQAEDLALAWSARGYQAFFLRYSFAGERQPLLPAPVIELAQSVALLRQHATDWQINPAQLIVAGFSVGGHIVALFNDLWADAAFNAQAHTTPEQVHPTAVILGYPVITPKAGFPQDAATLATWTDHPAQIEADQRVTNQNAPTFIWVTANDPLVPVQNALAYAQASIAHHVDTELHVFHNGPHGLALANPVTAWKPASDQPHVAHWLDLAAEWLTEIHASSKR